MKTLACSFFILGLGLFFAAFNTDSSTSESATSSEAYPGFAVVELFTSEGCSSCPSADGDQVSVTYRITGLFENSSLTLALVQKTAESKVRSGQIIAASKSVLELPI